MNTDDKRELIVIALCIAGLFAIYKVVPLIAAAVAGHFGKTVSRPIALLFVALFMYLWGRFCLYLRYDYRKESENEDEK